MSKSLSYVFVTPYTIAKSRTGGVISRLLSRTDLELVGARMFTPDNEFAKEYADILRKRESQRQLMLLADYAEKHFAPSGGRPNRMLMLLFFGENPCEKLADVCGHLYTHHTHLAALTGETIRDTYSDLIFSDNNPEEVRYFEPAVYTPRNQGEADAELKLIADFLENKENLIENVEHPEPSKVERTLVIIKPDNWKHSSSRPGAIIDMFSRTGLRIIGVKIHRFSLAQALDFYGPVEPILVDKLAPIFGKKAHEFLEKEFHLKLSKELSDSLSAGFGAEYARDQFYQIVEFMSGKRPGNHTPEEMQKPGDVMCMILVYEGENAVNEIRDVLGATDPNKAAGGTVRREFGSNVMVNTAHASDSPESYEREQNIVMINQNSLVSIIREQVR